jgi:hypothetical protein
MGGGGGRLTAVPRLFFVQFFHRAKFHAAGSLEGDFVQLSLIQPQPAAPAAHVVRQMAEKVAFADIEHSVAATQTDHRTLPASIPPFLYQEILFITMTALILFHLLDR